MMVQREREIQAFTPEPYRLVRAQFDPRYEGMWFEGDETRIFGDLSRAEQIVEKVTGKDGTVEKMEQKEQSERPPMGPRCQPSTPSTRGSRFSAARENSLRCSHVYPPGNRLSARAPAD